MPGAAAGECFCIFTAIHVTIDFSCDSALNQCRRWASCAAIYLITASVFISRMANKVSCQGVSFIYWCGHCYFYWFVPCQLCIPVPCLAYLLPVPWYLLPVPWYLLPVPCLQVACPPLWHKVSANCDNPCTISLINVLLLCYIIVNTLMPGAAAGECFCIFTAIHVTIDLCFFCSCDSALNQCGRWASCAAAIHFNHCYCLYFLHGKQGVPRGSEFYISRQCLLIMLM